MNRRYGEKSLMSHHTPSTAIGQLDQDTPEAEDVNLVEFWLRKDPVRWFAGALSGVFAGVVALAFAMIFSMAVGMEFWFPIKLLGTIVLGSSATEYGMNLTAIASGAVIFGVLTAVLGFVFSHFVFTNCLSGLLAMGLVWGVFSWIFICNLFAAAIRPILFSHVPPSATFPVCIVFGISLTSLAFFDRAFRGNSSGAR